MPFNFCFQRAGHTGKFTSDIEQPRFNVHLNTFQIERFLLPSFFFATNHGLTIIYLNRLIPKALGFGGAELRTARKRNRPAVSRAV
jgi:hypothetical protein